LIRNLSLQAAFPGGIDRTTRSTFDDRQGARLATPMEGFVRFHQALSHVPLVPGAQCQQPTILRWAKRQPRHWRMYWAQHATALAMLDRDINRETAVRRLGKHGSVPRDVAAFDRHNVESNCRRWAKEEGEKRSEAASSKSYQIKPPRTFPRHDIKALSHANRRNILRRTGEGRESSGRKARYSSMYQ
jgi:hypothetical protein